MHWADITVGISSIFRGHPAIRMVVGRRSLKKKKKKALQCFMLKYQIVKSKVGLIPKRISNSMETGEQKSN